MRHLAELEAEGTVLSMRYGFLSLEHERLKAERDRLREALQEIIDHDKRAWHVIAIAKKALEETA